MDLDDPLTPEFASVFSYNHFASRVRYNRRFVWDNEVAAFVRTVAATIKNRDVKLPKGRIFYQAQRGVVYEPVLSETGEEISEDIIGFSAQRMKPLVNRANQGRVNPSGIPALYVASVEQTAISEVRPWVGSEVSIAQFKTVRDLRAIDLSIGHGQTCLAYLEEIMDNKIQDAATKERAVWIDIDNAFSTPVTHSDDTAEYVPTQILAELFRSVGYDAVIYRSQFGENGYNIAIFQINDAVAINCAPYKVKSIEIDFKEIGNRWFASEHLTYDGQAT